ncbi:hypothetical protein N8Z24_00290 [bacterium]|nr:hypothetical protein [bacterium]
MTTTWGPIVYPTSLDSFTPALVDNVDEVIANHPNSLSDAITAIETKLGITGGLATGFGGVALTGLAASPAINSVWIDSSGGAGTYDLMYTDDSGVDYLVSGPGGTSGDNTLDDAYNEGGAGLGRTIAVDSGAVLFTVSTGNNSVLELVQNNIVSNPTILQLTNLGTGPAIDFLGAGSRSLRSTSGHLSISTITSGDININSIATVDIDGVDIEVDGSGGISVDAATASNFTVSGATADLTLGARAATITLNESGDTSLSGTFTATSLVGAINELLTLIVAEDLWDKAGTVLDPHTAGDTLQVGVGTKTAPSYSFEGDADTGIYQPSAGYIRFSTNDTDAVTINAVQNLGIAVANPTAARLEATVVNAANLLVAQFIQSDATNDPNAVVISNAGSGKALSLAGVGSRSISSTSGSMTLETLTSGDINIQSAGDFDFDADSISIYANAGLGGYFTLYGNNSLELYSANNLYISSEQVWISPYADTSGPFFSVSPGGGTAGLNNTSSTGIWSDFTARIEQGGTAGFTVLKIDTDNISSGSGTKKLLDVQYGGTPQVWITSDGVLHTIAKITGDAADLTLEGRSASITLNEVGQTALVGYTATSIIGALNEVLLGSAGTLDLAYDGGGSGAGRAITVDSGAVTMTVPDTSNNAALELTQSDITNGPIALSISNAGAGSSIELAGTTRVINSTSADLTLKTTTSGDLNLNPAGETLLDDGNRSGSTFSTAMKFSDTSTEWDNFESVFGEVSVLSGMVKAFGVPVENTDVDTGTENVDTFADTEGGAAVWELIISKGTNYRYSMIFAVWDAVNNTYEHSEIGTLHIGDTSDLSLDVDINTDTVRLRATAASDDWSVHGVRRIIK